MLPKAPMCSRTLLDRFAKKHVCLVVDDADYKKQMPAVSGTIENLACPKSIMSFGWSTFVQALPFLKSDFVLIISQEKLNGHNGDLEARLKYFRYQNPKAVIVVWDLHKPGSPESKTLEKFARDGIIHHLEQGFIQFPLFIHKGAELLEA